MVCTRGAHFASVDALPSASLAVFFLTGALLRSWWMLPLLFGIAALRDLIGLALGSSSDWCMSPAYWALALPAPCRGVAGGCLRCSYGAKPGVVSPRRCGRC